jgi:hypothetical protein
VGDGCEWDRRRRGQWKSWVSECVGGDLDDGPHGDGVSENGGLGHLRLLQIGLREERKGSKVSG